MPVQATFLRDALATWITEHGLPGVLTDEVKLAAYEALANVVTHAYPDGTDGTMTLTTTLTPGSLIVSVTDASSWRDGPSRPHGGRGLPMIHALAHETTVTTSPHGTTVTMAWPRPQ
ncbi:ATP-binding protein [Amycolatopsis thermoflava]|uniref:ATP-binding protein n=1 Tax=Amycolatopsis thermoflava TaxID=84480 RepID=UPI0036679C05